MRSIEKLGRPILRETGRKLATAARKDFVVGARQRIGGEDVLAPMNEPLLEIYGVMLGEFARLTKQVLDIVRDEPILRRLMSAPGVSPLTALAFRATIVAVPQIEGCRRSPGFDRTPLSIRRNGYKGAGQPMRRRTGAHGS